MNFAEEEERILEFWKSIDAFKTQNRLSKNRPMFTFYDGPPFATGLPHYGHILAGTVKDTVTRWVLQNGYQVTRRFGWDCHGLPVEHEVDKILKIQNTKEIESKYGIKKYNEICRETALKYTHIWKDQVTRMGRWIEFEDDYKTLYPWYMESVWWVFKELFNKNLIYRGMKVMPYSSGCCTPLSNFEANQNYKDVQDPSIWVAFPLVDSNRSLVAWTTTPWTLPSNLALCVHPDKTYCEVNYKNRILILMECRVSFLISSDEKYTIEKRFLGKELFNLRYNPPFEYYKKKIPNAFRVLTNTYVTDDVGTGVVHQAPYFGEDDYHVCIANGIIAKDDGLLACPLDVTGCFTDPVLDYAGMYVKDADKQIMKDLESKGLMVKRSQITHSYPFCWRSETPLLYRAVPSWLVNVEAISDIMCQLNLKSNWVPSNIQHGRFGNWLKNARDWCISRNRYWGNPIPLWVCEDDDKDIICVDSIEELERLSGQKNITDLHRESIDNIVIKKNNRIYRRTSEVFDCWFESGSMPFAQYHYPHKQMQFPADFVSEGVDQTRGWFYTLLVISTALKRQCPFKNVVVTGLILASNGEKMSKRLRNYPDPMEVVNKFGADALRMYLISSPVVKAESLKFREDGVRELQRDVFLPWINALRFLTWNIERLQQDDGIEFKFDHYLIGTKRISNPLDKWIISLINSNMEFIKKEMNAYRLYNVCPILIQFIENLTNWYIRLSRSNLRGENSTEECVTSLNVLFYVLFKLAHIMVPFTPFLAEHFYQKLKAFDSQLWMETDQSVHFRQIPDTDFASINSSIEESIASMRSLIETVRTCRDKNKLPFKQAISKLIVVCTNSEYVDQLQFVLPYVIADVNVKDVELTCDQNRFGIEVRTDPNFKTLGPKAKGAMKKLATTIQNMSIEKRTKLLNDETIEFDEFPDLQVSKEDVLISFKLNNSDEMLVEQSNDQKYICLLDPTITSDLKSEKIIKEVCNRIQRMRKSTKLVPTDPILVHISCEPSTSQLFESVKTLQNSIIAIIRQPLKFPSKKADCQTFEIEDGRCFIFIERISKNESSKNKSIDNGVIITTPSNVPSFPFVNVVIVCSHVTRKRYGQSIDKGTIFLQINEEKIQSNDELKHKICKLFDLNCNIEISTSIAFDQSVVSIEDLNGKTLYCREQGCNHDQTIQSNQKAVLAKFKNINYMDSVYSVFIENPVGCSIKNLNDLIERVKVILQCKNKIELFIDKSYSRLLTFKDIDWVEQIHAKLC